MFQQLEEVVLRYNELARQLGDPNVTSDSKRFQQIAKEHAGLRDLVETYETYRKTQKDLQGNKELLNESDEDLRQMAKEEIPRLEREISELEDKLKVLLLPTDPNDEKNIFLEMRAGTGGDEAALFVADLFRMYSRYAEARGWKVEIMDSNSTGIGGYKEMIAQISGDRVYSDLKYEGGVHRVQRVPKTETQGRIHTSAATVAVLPEAEEVDIKIDPNDLKIDVYRSTGPGGQSVNTTDSAVRLTHLPTGLVVAMQDEKSQLQNKTKALRVLRARLHDLERQRREDELSAQRRSQIGGGERAEKIRTYNYPENRVTDHRVRRTVKRLDQIVEGDLAEFTDALAAEERRQALEAAAGA